MSNVGTVAVKIAAQRHDDPDVDTVVVWGRCGVSVLCAGIVAVTAGCVDLAAPAATENDAGPRDAATDLPGNDDVPQDLSEDLAADLPVNPEAPADVTTPVVKGPIAYWPLDEARGTRFEDRTGRTGSGWALNGAAWISTDLAANLGTENRAALRFRGGSDYAILGAAGLPSNGAPLTITLWVNAAATTVPQIFIQLTDGLRAGLALGVRGDNLVAVDGQNQILLSVPTTGAGQWQHVGFSYDGAFSHLFVDGEMKAMVRTPPPLGAVLEVWLASARGRSSFFAGSIDDIRIYERALGDVEIADIAAGAP
ncbi:MAG TPA: LamG domain-containing protein, partial [Polyangia bacterium]|nr:LamG domain-containing protein [Polyangia bacterium]